MVVSNVQAEFRLNSGRVDAIFVKALADLLGKVHVACRAFMLEVEVDLDVKRGDELGIGQLPNMQMMTGDNTVKVTDVVFDVVNGEVFRNSLQQDARCSFAKWESREQNDDSDEEGNSRIGIVPPRKVRLPDEEGSCNDTNIA